MRISDLSSDVCSSDLCDDYDEQLKRQVAEEESGTWREQLRKDYAPWFEELYFGFQCGEGWRDIIVALPAEIAGCVGGPEGTPGLGGVQVKEKFGGLRYNGRGASGQHQEANRVSSQRQKENE